jgi:hypothetical protein
MKSTTRKSSVSKRNYSISKKAHRKGKKSTQKKRRTRVKSHRRKHRGGVSQIKEQKLAQLSPEQLRIRQANLDQRPLEEEELEELRYRATLSPEQLSIRRANQRGIEREREIKSLSDEDLSKKLGEFGYKTGPVTPATRPILEFGLKKKQRGGRQQRGARQQRGGYHPGCTEQCRDYLIDGGPDSVICTRQFKDCYDDCKPNKNIPYPGWCYV